MIEHLAWFALGVLVGVGASVAYYRSRMWAFIHELEASRQALHDAVNRAQPKE